MTCAIKDDDKFYSGIFLEDTLLVAYKMSSLGTF